MNPLNNWAQRWSIPPQALNELRTVLITADAAPAANRPAMSETAVQQRIRHEGFKRGINLWRNNRGATETSDGRHIRFGIANDTPEMNKIIKSSDLIGITPTVIQANNVGQIAGIFTSIEVKKPGWKYREADDHTAAQKKWLDLVNSLGGIGRFARNIEEAF